MGADTSLSRCAGSTSSRKRNRTGTEYAATHSSTSVAVASEYRAHTCATSDDAKPVKKRRKPAAGGAPTEKRLRRYRPQPPKSFNDLYHRAVTQRFYVLSRTRCGTADLPEEIVEMTGSTGNIYTVVITRQPRCDCPHAREGNQCKHVLYVLSRILHAKWEYVYQLALLDEELREIFRDAPPPASDGDEGRGGDGRRKPVEGDCPICFCEMEASGGEPVVWCRAACGQNIHKACFETWAATKRRQGAGRGESGEVTCPYCRSVWEGDEDMVRKIEKKGKRNAEGYVNVASQLGISTQRDYSTYSRWWSGHPSTYRRYY